MIVPGERLGCLRVVEYKVREVLAAKGPDEPQVLVIGLGMHHTDGRDFHYSVRLNRRPDYLGFTATLQIADSQLRAAMEEQEHRVATGHNDLEKCHADGCTGAWPTWEAA